MLAWIEMQLCTLRAEEAIAWVRIIENILTVVDARKVEAATNGDWRAAAVRCLKSILEHPGKYIFYNESGYMLTYPRRMYPGRVRRCDPSAA